MPNITVEYEVTHRISVDVEVSEETVRELRDGGNLDLLEEYGITQEDLSAQCVEDGWAEDNYAVSDEKGDRIISWSWE